MMMVADAAEYNTPLDHETAASWRTTCSLLHCPSCAASTQSNQVSEILMQDSALIRAALVAVHFCVILGCAICNAVAAMKNGPFVSIVQMSVSPSLQEIKSAVIMQESTL